jgi:hypothetical protein
MRRMKIQSDVTAVCGCGAECMDDDPFKWARHHADKHHHIPTVFVQYDIFPRNYDPDDPRSDV